jgi:dTDP-4-dehydrorhamnose reductase
VFDGEATRPYVETDDTNPLGVYGASKLAGERAIYQTGAAHLTFRTSGVYSEAPGNFVSTIRRAARTSPELKVVADQTGSPTSARTIARVTRDVVRQWKGARDERQGIYNLVAKGDPSRHALAVRIVELARENGETNLSTQDVKPILTSDLSAQPARRPRYSALDAAKLGRDFGVSLPTWETDLSALFRIGAP